MGIEKHSDKHIVKVKIMQREFTITCQDGQDQGAIEAARYLDSQMQIMSKKNQVMGIDRCAIMAALNITHEFLMMRKHKIADKEVSARLEKLHDQIDRALDRVNATAK